MDYLEEEDIDPFEARIQFTEILTKLTSSQQSVTNAAIFAMKYRKSYELLYDILKKEINNQPDIASRLNMFHVLDCICRYCLKINFNEYIDLIKKDLSSIISDITPENDAKGDANVKPVRKVLKGWRDKHFFSEDLLKNIYEILWKREQQFEEKHKAKQRIKNEVTKRIEDDRIKQKKRKENAWILTPDMDEFSYYWDNLPSYSTIDCKDIINENKVFYHGDYPKISQEHISKIFDRNEIELKLRSNPIAYNKENYEEELYHKNQNKEQSSLLNDNKDFYSRNYNSHTSPNKRIRVEKEKSISYNNINNKNNDKNKNEYDKDIRNNKYKYNKYDKNDDKYDKNDDKYDKYDKYNKYSKYDNDNNKSNRYDKYGKLDRNDKEEIYDFHSNTEKSKLKNRIFVWDLDETLILFKSLLDRNCLEIKPQDTDLGVKAGKEMMKWIINISEKYFYYNDIEEKEDPYNLNIYDNIPLDIDLKYYEFDKDNINNISKGSNVLNKLLSYRYKAIKKKYDSNTFRDNIQNINIIDKIYDDIDHLSHQWLSFMLSLLDGVKLSGSYGKAADCVLVSAGHLIPTLAKCVIYKLSNIFSSDKVWSSSKNGKSWCFKEIRKKYGDNYEYIVVGNSNEENVASKENGWSFFKITDKRSLIEFNKLYIDS